MKSAYINGIGIISRCAQGVADLCALAAGKKQDYDKTGGTVTFTAPLTQTQVRRASRCAKLAVSAATFAVQDSPCMQGLGGADVGTVLATGYGAVESTVQFTAAVLRGVPAKCSPIVFAATVPNSAVGQICMVHGFTGASTQLIGGDPLEYAALLVQGGRAKAVLAGAVEEYNSDLASSLHTAGALGGAVLSEGAAVLVLSAEQREESWCRTAGFASVAFPASPYAYVLSAAEQAQCSALMAHTLRALGKTPDLVLTAQNGGQLDGAEAVSVAQAFGADTPTFAYKQLFGECLGAGYIQGAALAAAMLKTGSCACIQSSVPAHGLHTVCVSGIDAQGNYMAALFESA